MGLKYSLLPGTSLASPQGSGFKVYATASGLKGFGLKVDATAWDVARLSCLGLEGFGLKVYATAWDVARLSCLGLLGFRAEGSSALGFSRSLGSPSMCVAIGAVGAPKQVQVTSPATVQQSRHFTCSVCKRRTCRSRADCRSHGAMAKLFNSLQRAPVPRMIACSNTTSRSFEEHNETVLAQVPNYLRWQRPRSTPPTCVQVI